MEFRTVITIARQFGSGGHEIGKMVAEKLQIPFYDKKIIAMAAEESGISDRIIRENEERAQSGIIHAFNRSNRFFANQPFLSNQIQLNDQVFLIESEIIRDLANKGPCVVIGRSANYVLREYLNCLRIFVHADFQSRLERIKELYQMDDHKAEDFLRSQDKQRSHYYSFYTDQKWNAAENYDLAVNSTLFGIENTAAMIVLTAKMKNKISS